MFVAEGLGAESGILGELGAFATGVSFVGGGLLVALTAASIYALREADKDTPAASIG